MYNLETFDVIDGIMRASNEHSSIAAATILEIISLNFPINACSFYSFNEMNKQLSLRAQQGLS